MADPVAPSATPVATLVPSQSGLVPTASTWVGATVGAALSQVIVGAFDFFFHTTMTPAIAAAVGVLCAAGVGYFANGGKR